MQMEHSIGTRETFRPIAVSARSVNGFYQSVFFGFEIFSLDGQNSRRLFTRNF